MNKKPIDKTKKSNIKCEHCRNWNKKHTQTVMETNGVFHLPVDLYVCDISGEPKHYYNRCKLFEWKDSEVSE